MIDQQGFLLTRQWRDTRSGVELEFWLSSDNGPVQLIVAGHQSVFFVALESCSEADQLLQVYRGWTRKDVQLRDFSMGAVCAYYFSSQRTLRDARDSLMVQGIVPMEADINVYDRFLMERFVRGALRFRGVAEQRRGVTSIKNPDITSGEYQPDFKVLSLDIETAIHDLSLYSIGLYAGSSGDGELRKVFMVAQDAVAPEVAVYPDEKSLLLAFFDWLAEYDPDIIIGWNVINFDMWYLQRVCDKYQIPLKLGRRGVGNNRGTVHWRNLDDEGERKAMVVTGRVVIDGIELLKAATYQFESFSLNNVAGEVLGDGKLIAGNDRGQKITDLYLTDKPSLAAYNLQDCKLVWDIFTQTKLLNFAIARSRMTGLALDRIGGSVASFDYRYLPLLHRQGFVGPNGHLREDVEASPGGLVLDSQPGIYDHVVVLDFKSLYPSIIRSFKIDPMGMAIGLEQELDQDELVPGFKGAWFSRDKHLLPGIIADLWQARDAAKASDDSALSQAIKIIMNSFYGVLGSGGCRFFDSRLASSITRRGHQIIQQTTEFIEAQGYSVIYGDTDSVFVWLQNIESTDSALAVGRELEKQLNSWWQKKLAQEYGIDCALEIEFETHYQRFLMPTVRGSDQGSKKRYAGVVMENNEPKLVFKGLESVRTDWTKLAREFQVELYRRIFFNEPYRDYIQQTVAQVLDGGLDGALVYRKRLRRKLEDYQRNIPPHVQAARKAASQDGMKIRRGDWIEYVITVNGAEPVAGRQSLVDYQHYIDRQLAPVADSILYFLDESLEGIAGQQLGLFG